VNDGEILDRIRSLVDEEHTLRGAGQPVDDDRLQDVEEMLDQCWDLLRRRRARREFGDDPDATQARDIGTVEGYQQ
jgi:hypothetical protein